MGSEGDIIDAMLHVKDIWGENLKDHLLASLEYILIIFTILFIFIPLLMLMQFAVFIPLILLVDYGIIWMLPFIIVITLVLYGIMMGISITAGGITMGGTGKISRNILHGKRYEFFDIFREGWKRKWGFIRVQAAIVVVQIIIMNLVILILNAFTIPFLFLVQYNPSWILPIIFISSISFIILIPLSIFLLPLPYIAFHQHIEKNMGGWRSVKQALSFMNNDRKQTFIFGGLMYIISMIGSMVPGLNILVAGAMSIFAHQIVDIYMKEYKK